MTKVAIAIISFYTVFITVTGYETPAFENYQVSNCTNNSNFITLGEQIKDARKEKKMSIHELSKRCNLSVNQLKDVEAGKAEPMKTITVQIEKILEASFVYEGYYYIP